MITDKPMPLHLNRHGETAWSLSDQNTGRTDIPLTAHGDDAAWDVELRGTPFAHVLTSPLQRSQQTCALAEREPVPAIEADLAEWDNGDDERQTPTDILASRSGWNLFRDGSPHGESPTQISARADRLVARLRTLDECHPFSHSHLGRVLAVRWIGLSVGQAQHFLLDTAPISQLSRCGTPPNPPAAPGA